MRDIEEVAANAVHASVRIHRKLGPGLLESVYESILARVLVKQGYLVERQKPIRFEYEGLVFEDACRVDLLVDGQLIIEVESVEHLARSHPSSCWLT